VWRCDMHAEELVGALQAEGVAAQAVLDLRELHSMVTPEATEVRSCAGLCILHGIHVWWPLRAICSVAEGLQMCLGFFLSSTSK
jgi:hypothetical protein